MLYIAGKYTDWEDKLTFCKKIAGLFKKFNQVKSVLHKHLHVYCTYITLAKITLKFDRQYIYSMSKKGQNTLKMADNWALNIQIFNIKAM